MSSGGGGRNPPSVRAHELDSVCTSDLHNNTLTTFSGQMPLVTSIDLSRNALQEFKLASNAVLQSLSLAKNNLTKVPTAVFLFPALKKLNSLAESDPQLLAERRRVQVLVSGSDHRLRSSHVCEQLRQHDAA
jgi:Leucine-rich repeat (LRR) protein